MGSPLGHFLGSLFSKVKKLIAKLHVIMNYIIGKNVLSRLML